MTLEVLHAQRDAWLRKPVLRAIYEDYYRRIREQARPGRSLEIGGGSGNLKQVLPDVVSIDIVATPWLDVTADAQALPFQPATFDNLIMIDVLHHIEFPVRFFAEAQRVLRPGGRLIMVEPAITPVSWVFYTLLHPEPVIMNADPLADGTPAPDRKPFDANQAIPTLTFGRFRERFGERFPQLSVARVERLSFFAYPLSGGFRPWSLIPRSLVAPFLKMEDLLAPVLGRLLGFRLFVVIDKL
jgi:SAM-dependent methyltransferase